METSGSKMDSFSDGEVARRNLHKSHSWSYQAEAKPQICPMPSSECFRVMRLGHSYYSLVVVSTTYFRFLKSVHFRRQETTMHVSESCMLWRESVAGWSIRGSALKIFSKVQGKLILKTYIALKEHSLLFNDRR